ncbi:MAG: asparaginase [Pseudomonadota bacterium]
MTGKTIFILYVGGTIGMEAGASGFAPGTRLVSQIEGWVAHHPGLSAHRFVIESVEPLLDSANAAPKNWFDLAATLWTRRDSADGFVILHGTDTLAYTSSALSFLTKGFGKPIVITGAQIPASVPASDGEMNTVGSIICALDARIQETSVFFGGRLMRGNRVRKWSSDGLDGFQSPHWPALALMTNELAVDPSALLAPRTSAPPALNGGHDISVGLLKLYPGMSNELISAAAGIHPDGLVLELYGGGAGPAADPSIGAALQRATAGGTPIVGVSQCFRGSVDLEFYEAGRAFADSGVIGGRDLTAEAALTKLIYLRSLGISQQQIQQEITHPIAGEVTI